jgi:acetyltransferase-like isoleucine patch superfamily enzyme
MTSNKSYIARTAIIHENVSLGESVIIEDGCIIGLPFAGMNGECTTIGDNAHIRAGTYIYAGNTIGQNFQTGNKANIRELNVIGDDVSIGTLSTVEHHVNIGNDVRIHSQVFIPEFTILNDGCWLGPNVVITNARYPMYLNSKQTLQAVVINGNAKIGANSTILPGVEIGKNSLIGAGSVVTKNISSNIIAYGSPAIEVREIHY